MASSSAPDAPATAKHADAENYEMPWCVRAVSPTNNRVEKYRPILLKDIVGNTDTVDRLKVIAGDGNMPHIIISVGAAVGVC